MTITEKDAPPPAMIWDHPAHHPGHKLKRVGNDAGFFICDGCMEPGAGTRYRCERERCNFDLHTCCAVAPDILTHPMFGDHRVFVFLREIEPPSTSGPGGKENGKRSSRVCIACGEDVRGFLYHCFDDDDNDDDRGGIDLHPCCAQLPEHALRGGPTFALGKEDDDDDQRSRREIRGPAAARHRQWAGLRTQPGRPDPPPENTHLVFHELRQETRRPSDDRTRGREHRPPAARHRWWKR